MKFSATVELTSDDLSNLRQQFYKDLEATGFSRSDEDLDGAVLSHVELARDRALSDATIRIIRPTREPDGWTADGNTLVEVVVDDLPFLVDSISAHLIATGRTIHRVIHPLMVVSRDPAGALTALHPDEDPRGFTPVDGRSSESWIQFEIDAISQDDDRQGLHRELVEVVRQARLCVNDWAAMETRAWEIVQDLSDTPPPVPTTQIDETRELLTWLADGHFTFLGYREYRLTATPDGREALAPVEGTPLGLMRDKESDTALRVLPPPAARKAADPELLIVTKANSFSPVHRRDFFDYIGVKTFDENGKVDGERRFIGLLSTAAYAESIRRIPILHSKATSVVEHLDYHPESHNAKTVMDILEDLPRDELFQSSVAQLALVAHAVLHQRERRELRLFARRDIYDRFVSFLVYMPRDSYTTSNQELVEDFLAEAVGGNPNIASTTRLAGSVLARIHVVVRPERGHQTDFDETETAALEHRLAEATRTWREGFQTAVRERELAEPELVLWHAEGFSESYKEDFHPSTGVEDILRLKDATNGEHLSVQVKPVDSESMRIRVFRMGSPLTLSAILPWLSSLGVDVTDERPYTLRIGDDRAWIYDFGVCHEPGTTEQDRDNIADSFLSSWTGAAEVDGLNQLLLAADMDWRQVMVLRAYAAYLRQANVPFTPAYVEASLRANARTAQLLVNLFESRLAPWGPEGGLDPHSPERASRISRITAELEEALDQVSSLDEDRILRAFRSLIEATLRTNAFQVDADGTCPTHLSLKLDPQSIDELPEPRPRFEIFCYSPQVEGVHLRYGAVSRGGLRWSDRKEDFRTEVLGLVKAQMVKNTVIVPVGSKGGFFAKQLPHSSDRDAWLTEGRASYRVFIESLLDVTDNLVDGEVVPPANVVRWDEDDTYLVVAADKGTAAFSDLANEVSLERGYWLGDAFASGGSVGYDHKAMAITARGAWESTKKHFREIGVDCQNENFTAAGIGDMSGDVFGNGMLQSRHTRLLAAFDHRHIFIDPNPEAAPSYEERTRLSNLPRSSWEDYDPSLISEGGGVFSRHVKSISITPEIRSALGLRSSVDAMSPLDLMQAVLCAPVDLLFNGGIGTYVKSHVEAHEEVGDKANNAVRVDGQDLRARIVVEGGNLGFTQRGRIEYALKGGPGRRGGIINTDFIDNSAGVGTSDHEVNIKILLDRIVAAGDLDTEARNTLLASMTDEVAELVLTDNREQNIALVDAAGVADPMFASHVSWMKHLAHEGVLDPVLEDLPDEDELDRRRGLDIGMTRPELAVLMAYSKIHLANQLADGTLASEPWFEHLLRSYFPEAIQRDWAEAIGGHPLRDQIIVMGIVNGLVNRAGFSFIPAMLAETGVEVVDVVRAEAASVELFDIVRLRREVESLPIAVRASVQTEMRAILRSVTERASRWLITHGGVEDVGQSVDRYRSGVEELVRTWDTVVTGRERELHRNRRDSWVEAGVPTEVAQSFATLAQVSVAFGIVATAIETGSEQAMVAQLHFVVSEQLSLDRLGRQIAGLPRDDRWDAMARASLRQDLQDLQSDLVRQVLGVSQVGDAEDRVKVWSSDKLPALDKVANTLADLWADDVSDLSRMSVAVRYVRTLLP